MDKSEFRGVDFISDRLDLGNIDCHDSVVLPVSAIDSSGLETALNWVLNAIA